MAPTVRKKRIAVLVHKSLVPPEDAKRLPAQEFSAIRTEYDVIHGLRELNHEVEVVGLDDELHPLRQAIDDFKPHVVFNLLEEFRDQAIFDAHVVGYLELRGIAYTGCNPRGLFLARDKALSKKILTYHRIQMPRFAVFTRFRKIRRPKQLEYPLIVKSLNEEASLGIAQASFVTNDKALQERVEFIHEKIHTDALVEQFIGGRELYSSVLGVRRFHVFPTWELYMDELPDAAVRIATENVKWNLSYQKKHNIYIDRAKKISDELKRHIETTSRRICHRLGTDGCVRVDYRLSEDGKLYFLEANPNPDIGSEEEFASAAAAKGIKYDELLHKVVSLGIRRFRENTPANTVSE